MRSLDMLQKDNNFERIYSYLQKVKNDDFTMNISDLNQYSKKLSDNATVIFLNKFGEDVAMIAFYTNDTLSKISFITSISVLPQFQRNGIGQYLMNIVTQESLQKSMTKLKLEVSKSNTKAIKFYIHNGFVLGDATEESIFMNKQLDKNTKIGK